MNRGKKSNALRVCDRLPYFVCRSEWADSYILINLSSCLWSIRHHVLRRWEILWELTRRGDVTAWNWNHQFSHRPNASVFRKRNVSPHLLLHRKWLTSARFLRRIPLTRNPWSAMAANPPLCQANLTLANAEKCFLHINVGAEYLPVIFDFCHCYDYVHKVNPELKDVSHFLGKIREFDSTVLCLRSL